MLANRVLAVDHVRHRTDLFALGHDKDPDAERWLDEAEAVVREVLAASPGSPSQAASAKEREPAPAEEVAMAGDAAAAVGAAAVGGAAARPGGRTPEPR